MKTFLFFFSSIAAMAAFYSVLFLGATHQLLIFSFCTAISRVLYTDRSYGSSSVKEKLVPYIAVIRKSVKTISHIRIVTTHESKAH